MTAGNTQKMAERFRLNIQRIAGLTSLVLSKDGPLKPKALFQYDGVSADVWRAAVVFLHATFEDSLQTLNPRPGKSGIYSRSDIDKALRRANIDSTPFRPLYPPLTQMAKRRLRIVHEADILPNGKVEDFGFTDIWTFGMWNLSVVAFHYLLLVTREPDGPVKTLWEMQHTAMRRAMVRHTDFAHKMIGLADEQDHGKARIIISEAAEILSDMVLTIEGPQRHFGANER